MQDSHTLLDLQRRAHNRIATCTRKPPYSTVAIYAMKISGYPILHSHIPGLKVSGSSSRMSRGGANRSALERKTPCGVPEELGSAFPEINHHDIDMNTLSMITCTLWFSVRLRHFIRSRWRNILETWIVSWLNCDSKIWLTPGLHYKSEKIWLLFNVTCTGTWCMVYVGRNFSQFTCT